MPRLIARDPHEKNRAATPLELLFDLCFVVAIAQVAASLHHGIGENHASSSVFSYAIVFFAIWWAWMGFTWFASAFDNDGPAYRLKVFIQMAGMLVLAAGVPRAFNEQDFWLITIGYSIIRVGMIAMWLRAGAANSEFKTTARRYAVGLTICQAGWIAIASLEPNYWLYGWAILAPAELLVPILAERARTTPWHAHHISERYGLMMIIVIGETVLAGTLSVQSAVDSTHSSIGFLPVIIGAPVVFFSLWWIYFSNHSPSRMASSKQAFIWGYSHFIIYAAAAAVGAGIGVLTDYYGHHAHVSATGAGLAVSIPSAVFLLFVAIAQKQLTFLSGVKLLIFGIGSALCFFSGFLPYQPLGTAFILSTITGALVLANKKEGKTAAS